MTVSNANEPHYRINFTNNSTKIGNVMVFQKPHNPSVDLFSLAWFSRPVYPGNSVGFDWALDYSFVWAETGILRPGVMFPDSQHLHANLKMANSIGLTYNNEWNFVNQSQEIPHGSLYIKEDETVPLNRAAVGIGISGSAAFVAQAEPNKMIQFTPDHKAEYWITFGNYEKGEILDVDSIMDCALIDFADGVYSVAVELQRNHTWWVFPRE